MRDTKYADKVPAVRVFHTHSIEMIEFCSNKHRFEWVMFYRKWEEFISVEVRNTRTSECWFCGSETPPAE